MFNALRLSSSIATPAAAGEEQRLVPLRPPFGLRWRQARLQRNRGRVFGGDQARMRGRGREHAIDAMGQGCKRSAVSEWNRLPSSIEMSDTLAYQIGVEPNLTKHQTY